MPGPNPLEPSVVRQKIEYAALFGTGISATPNYYINNFFKLCVLCPRAKSFVQKAVLWTVKKKRDRPPKTDILDYSFNKLSNGPPGDFHKYPFKLKKTAHLLGSCAYHRDHFVLDPSFFYDNHPDWKPGLRHGFCGT